MAESDQFSISDVDALLELIYSNPSGRIVIVGGQAVNFWADRYAPEEPKLHLYRPFTSRDLDLLASIANAYRLASEARSVIEKPRHRTASPVLANVEVKTGEVVRSVQFLKSIRGVTNREIDDSAVQFKVGDVQISVADPITMLKSKVHNLVELDQRGRNDRNHVEILQLCVPLFLERQLTAAEETDAAARECLRNMQRVLELNRSAIAKQIRDFDWKALSSLKRLNEARNRRLKNFREQQLQRWLKTLHEERTRTISVLTPGSVKKASNERSVTCKNVRN